MKIKIKPLFLVLAILVTLGGRIFFATYAKKMQVSNYETCYQASLRMEKALEEIKKYCIENDISLESEDINGTFLIGPEISELVSTMGYPEVKRTTINANNAAVMVRLFEEAGLKRGDTIGIGSSGSFPAYAIATVCAATEMGLKTKVIASFGASMYGASRTELSIVKILQIVRDSKIADFEIVAISPGGANDSGVGSFDDFFYDNTTRDTVLSLAKESGEYLIDEPNLAVNVQRRLEALGDIDCFVNIGGAITNNGNGSEAVELDAGVIRHVSNMPKNAGRGLIFEYLDEGVPVINILNIKDLTSKYEMPLDPSPLPMVGDGGVYYENTYPVWALALTILLALGLCYIGIKNN